MYVCTCVHCVLNICRHAYIPSRMLSNPDIHLPLTSPMDAQGMCVCVCTGYVLHGVMLVTRSSGDLAGETVHVYISSGDLSDVMVQVAISSGDIAG